MYNKCQAFPRGKSFVFSFRFSFFFFDIIFFFFFPFFFFFFIFLLAFFFLLLMLPSVAMELVSFNSLSTSYTKHPVFIYLFFKNLHVTFLILLFISVELGWVGVRYLLIFGFLRLLFILSFKYS